MMVYFQDKLFFSFVPASTKKLDDILFPKQNFLKKALYYWF